MSHSNPSQEYDHLTIWCKNKQAMANLNLTDSQMKSSGLQDEIIDGVFGGFRNVISLLLRVVGTHSMIMLQSVLEAKSQTQSQSPQMTELPIDCLCHSFQYLTTDDRITAQQCCRSFAIDRQDVQPFIDAFARYPYVYGCIQRYGAGLSDKLKHLLKRGFENNDKLIEIGVRLFTAKNIGITAQFDYFDALHYLNYVPSTPLRLEVVDDILQCMIDSGPAYLVSMHDSVVEAIYKQLSFLALDDPWDEWTIWNIDDMSKNAFIEDMCHILNGMLKCYPFSKVRESILDHGFITTLELSFGATYDQAYDAPQSFWSLLCSFLETASVEEAALVWNSDVLRNAFEWYSQHGLRRESPAFKMCVNVLSYHGLMRK
eukprot:254671_1